MLHEPDDLLLNFDPSTCRIVTLDEILAYGAASWQKGRPLGLYIETKVILLLALVLVVLECAWISSIIGKSKDLIVKVLQAQQFRCTTLPDPA